MRSPPAARRSGHELGGRPRNYGHLLGLAARYARTWLDGLTVVNAETGWPIGLRWSRGLEQAVAPGVPPVLLQAMPALPHMLAEARYLGTLEDAPPRFPVRRLHSFAAAATVAGQPHEAVLIVREDPLGRLFFDGFLARGSDVAARKDDGGLLDPRVVRPPRRVPRRQVGGGTPAPDDAAAARTASTEDSVADAVAPVSAAPNTTGAASEPTASIENSFGDDVAPPPATPNATDDTSAPTFANTSELLPAGPPQPAVPVLEPRAPLPGWETLPPGDARDAAQYGYALDEWQAMQRGAPSVPSRQPGLDHMPNLPRIDPHPPWEDIDREDVWNKRNARMAALKAQGIDPRTDPVLAELNRKFAKSIAQDNETVAVIGAPIGGIGKGLVGLGEWGLTAIGRSLARSASEIRLPPSGLSPTEIPALPLPQDVAPEVAADAEQSSSAAPKRLGSRKYQRTFFAAHPELYGHVRVHHAIEQQVLDNYPGLISKEEMDALENLRGIPNEFNNRLHSSTIRKEWNPFYRENPNATREQLFQKRDEIDAKYGSQFMPPMLGGEE